MSIWSTWLNLDDEPWGTRAPVIYQHSGVMPTDTSRRGGLVQVAAIPADIRDENAAADQVLPWLRLSLNHLNAVLDHGQVQMLHDTLGLWLERQQSTQEGTS